VSPGPANTARVSRSAAVRRRLDTDWELARSVPDRWADPAAIPESEWLGAEVPGTAASATGDTACDYDAEDWWFRVRFAASPAAPGEQVRLVLDGVATVFEAVLNGEPVLAGASMHVRHEVDVSDRLRAENTLVIVCRALGPLLAERRRPRARWRTQLVSAGNLRFYRTMLLGRAAGFAPAPAVVGPYREIALVRQRGAALDGVRLRPRLQGDDGVLSVRARVRVPPGAEPPRSAVVTVTPRDRDANGVTAELALTAADGEWRLEGEVRVTEVASWWPHTHGTPALYDVRIAVDEAVLYTVRTGFRSLCVSRDIEAEGLAVKINGAPVFARGAVWTPADLSRPSAGGARLRTTLEQMVAAGMNMVRVAGIGTYESAVFHDLCDELGILVWQDFMFANLDYPESDADFMAVVRQEAESVLAALAGRPSLVVLCGSSEVAQQVAMLGLDPVLALGPLYGDLLPAVIAAADTDAVYVPSTPWGGDMPFRPDRGVANYYGVGAYRRPLTDARRSDVRFAAECLAFANVPDDEALEALGAGVVPAVHTPAWKAGVPRDTGAGWDFDDVRDHYVAELFGVDPVALRSVEPERYRDLARQATGEVMAEVFGEWRRAESACAGGLVLWLQDHRPGAGWGVLDHRGEPKVAYHHLRRALAPIAVWSSDEGLGGIVAHVANDTSASLQATLRVALYRNGELPVGQASVAIVLGPRAMVSHNVEALIGRFVDVNWSYRFGPPAQDLVVLSLERERDGITEVVSQVFRHPAGRPGRLESAAELGLAANLDVTENGNPVLSLRTRRFAYGVRVRLPGLRPSDDAFGLEPGHERRVPLVRAVRAGVLVGPGVLTALNLDGRVPITQPAAS